MIKFPQSTNLPGLPSATAANLAGNTFNTKKFLNTNNSDQMLKDILLGTLPPGAEPEATQPTIATFVPSSNQQPDWRVKLSVPSLATFRSSPILSPLASTGYNCVFPITPTINIVHQAMYDEFTPVHNNYPYPSYTSSRVDDITIAGSFPVQTQEDGKYWIAAVHLFRSLTKMFYGESSNKGAPPPIVKLNGYGEFVLKDVPVVITQFAYEMPNNVDYIQISSNGGNQMVPTNSTLSVTCKPIYSRAKTNTFSLDDFVNGNLSNKGFI